MPDTGPARICVLGSINMDLVVRTPRLPNLGETLLGGPFSTSPGGKGANQAVAAARMGAEVSFVGSTGDDAHGRAMLDTLAAEHIDTSRIAARPGTPTGIAVITVAESGENTIVVAPGANSSLTPADIDAAREAIASADVLLMQLETPLPVVSRAAELARDLGTTVILNAAPAARIPLALLASIDALVVNESEAALLSAAAFAPTTPAPAADELEALLLRTAALGVSTSVLTAGSRGALFAYGKETGRVAACDVNPIDTVGAGDAFCGALAVRLAEHQIGGRGGIDHMGLMDAVCWASAAGALATTKQGAIPSLPSRPDVVAMLRTHPA